VIHRRPNGIDLCLVHRHALANGPQIEEVPTECLALPSVAAVDGDLLAFAKGGDHGLVGRLVLGVRS
jgi:hypothetical protein